MPSRSQLNNNLRLPQSLLDQFDDTPGNRNARTSWVRLSYHTRRLKHDFKTPPESCSSTKEQRQSKGNQETRSRGEKTKKGPILLFNKYPPRACYYSPSSRIASTQKKEGCRNIPIPTPRAESWEASFRNFIGIGVKETQRP